MDIKYKQFVVVPKNPKMSPGKLVSQGCHATFMALEKQQGYEEDNVDAIEIDKIIKWKDGGMCVVVLECESATELFGISKYLEQWNVPNHLYIDEGLTEVNMGTPTALATGVLTEDQFWMFSTMKLFGVDADAESIVGEC